jgi:type I restriction enzyme S subunit
MNKIADVFVTVPSIEKQQEIIDLEVQLVEKELSVEKLLSDQLNQIENLNQAILQEAVQGKLVKQDKKDEPASELLKRIKAEKVKSGKKEKPLPPIKPEEIPFEIPENWVWCRLGEICEIKGGKRVRNGYKLLRTPTDHIYIRVTDMKNGSISKNDIHYIDEKMFEAIKQYTISENDLYITIAGTIGEVGEVPEMFNGANLTENAAKFVFDNELVNRIWLRNILSSKHSQVQFLDKTKKVTAQPKLALTRIATTLIPLPPLAEQNNIVTETEKQKAKTKQLKEHIIANQQATEQLLKALLHQAFEVEESVGV